MFNKHWYVLICALACTSTGLASSAEQKEAASKKYLSKLLDNDRTSLANAYTEALELPQDEIVVPNQASNRVNTLPPHVWRPNNIFLVQSYMKAMQRHAFEAAITQSYISNAASWSIKLEEDRAQEMIQLTADSLRPSYKKRPLLLGINILSGIVALCSLTMAASSPANTSKQSWWQATKALGGAFGITSLLSASFYKKDVKKHAPWNTINMIHKIGLNTLIGEPKN